MKILLIVPQPFYTVRGTPIAVRQLAEALSRRGWEIDLLTNHVGDDVSIPRVRIVRGAAVPGIRTLSAGFSVGKILCGVVILFKALGMARRGKYDYVHAVEESVFMAMLLRVLFRVPFVYDMDSSIADQLMENGRLWRLVAPVLRFCETAALRRATHVLAVCDALVDRARGAGAENVTVLRDAPVFGGGAATRPATARPEDSPVTFAYVGNLEPYQGIDLMIGAFARLGPDDPAASLVIVGGSDDAIAACRRLAERLGAAERVRFTGAQPPERVEAILADADVLVSPRRHGLNTPMKIYSYLMCGKPILATAIPSHTQVLSAQVAMLVPCEEKAMAGGMRALARDHGLRESLAAAAGRLADEKYSQRAFEDSVSGFCDAVTAALRRRT